MMRFQSMGELRYYLEAILNDLENQGFRSEIEQVHKESKEYLQGKRCNYSGSDYIEQLEKNVIYLAEASFHVVRETARYVCSGIPWLEPDEASEYVYNLRVDVMPMVPAHLAFLRMGCAGCVYHDKHARWSSLKAKRDEGVNAAYIEELEFSIVYYQDLFRVTQNFLTSMLVQPEWAGVGVNLPLEDVYLEIRSRVDFRIQLYTGNVTRIPAKHIETVVINQQVVQVEEERVARIGDAVRSEASIADQSIAAQQPIVQVKETVEKSLYHSLLRRIFGTRGSQK